MTYLLAQNLETQTALRAEIRQHVPSPCQDIAQDDLAEKLAALPLFNAKINETLRLFPAINTLYRESVRPTSLMGHVVPLKTQVILSAWAINRSKALWGGHAEDFLPERWIDIDADSSKSKPNNSGGVILASPLVSRSARRQKEEARSA